MARVRRAVALVAAGALLVLTSACTATSAARLSPEAPARGAAAMTAWESVPLVDHIAVNISALVADGTHRLALPPPPERRVVHARLCLAPESLQAAQEHLPWTVVVDAKRSGFSARPAADARDGVSEVPALAAGINHVEPDVQWDASGKVAVWRPVAHEFVSSFSDEENAGGGTPAGHGDAPDGAEPSERTTHAPMDIDAPPTKLCATIVVALWADPGVESRPLGAPAPIVGFTATHSGAAAEQTTLSSEVSIDLTRDGNNAHKVQAAFDQRVEPDNAGTTRSSTLMTLPVQHLHEPLLAEAGGEQDLRSNVSGLDVEHRAPSLRRELVECRTCKWGACNHKQKVW